MGHGLSELIELGSQWISQKLFVEHEYVIIVDAWVTKSVERTKYRLICCCSENQGEIAGRSASAKQAVHCRSGISKRSSFLHARLGLGSDQLAPNNAIIVQTSGPRSQCRLWR